MGNWAIVLPRLQEMDGTSFMLSLGKPKVTPLRASPGDELPPNVPPYLVEPARFQQEDFPFPGPVVKLTDFGEAFFANEPPIILDPPQEFSAPEMAFGCSPDKRLDV